MLNIGPTIVNGWGYIFDATTGQLAQQSLTPIPYPSYTQPLGESPPGVRQIQDHFAKAEKVVMDFRKLTPQNQQILMDYLNTLPSAQRSRVLIVKN